MYKIGSLSRFYGLPEEEFHSKLWKSLLERHSTIKNVSRILDLPIKQLYRWKEEETCYPLSSLNRLADEAGLKVEGSLVYIKTPKSSTPLYDPKISFQPSSKLVEFFAHLLHDGGIDNDFRVHYTTHSKKAAKRFDYLIRVCFGRTKGKLKDQLRKTTIYFPAIIGKVINDVFDIPKGSKVKNDISIPAFVFEAEEADQWIYVCAAYFCDGVKDRVSIVSSSNSINKESNLLKGLARIMRNLGIRHEIKPSVIYKLIDGSYHRRWVLNVKNRKDKEIFLEKYHDYKLLL